jgi:hypothetical protein
MLVHAYAKRIQKKYDTVDPHTELIRLLNQIQALVLPMPKVHELFGFAQLTGLRCKPMTLVHTSSLQLCASRKFKVQALNTGLFFNMAPNSQTLIDQEEFLRTKAAEGVANSEHIIIYTINKKKVVPLMGAIANNELIPEMGVIHLSLMFLWDWFSTFRNKSELFLPLPDLYTTEQVGELIEGKVFSEVFSREKELIATKAINLAWPTCTYWEYLATFFNEGGKTFKENLFSTSMQNVWSIFAKEWFGTFKGFTTFLKKANEQKWITNEDLLDTLKKYDNDHPRISITLGYTVFKDKSDQIVNEKGYGKEFHVTEDQMTSTIWVDGVASTAHHVGQILWSERRNKGTSGEIVKSYTDESGVEQKLPEPSHQIINFNSLIDD